MKTIEGPSGQNIIQLHRIDTKRKNKGTLVLANSQIFDAIRSIHEVGHDKGPTLHAKLQAAYYNVTARQCDAYVKLCFQCQSDQPKIAPLKGAEKPIYSAQFRDRLQVDLIDMNNHPAINEDGIEQKWIMTCKDHFTGFVWLRPLRRKEAARVARQLNVIFGSFGYPMIFHTDNGKEFTAQTVIELVKSHHPGIITVTGRPRTPRDQGSVENADKQVKDILGWIEQFERDRGVVNPNWIDLLPRVETTMNSRPQKNSGNVSAFEAVFGLKYDFPVSCDHAIIRQLVRQR